MLRLIKRLPLFILVCCQPEVTPYEIVEKNDAFFKGMAKKVPGKFALLQTGVTYYEESNPKSTKGTLVLVHGFSVPSYIWSPTYETATQKGYRVIRMDLYGRGYSANPDIAYTDALFARQVLELLDFLKVEKGTFFGLSNGGRVISKIAALQPDRIEKLVYVASSGFSEKTPHEDKTVSKEEINAFIETYPQLAGGQMADFKNPEQFPDWASRYESLLQFKGFARALISTRKNHITLDTEHLMIAKSGIPVFTIWGDSDPVVVYDTFKDRLARLLPNRNEVFISNSGHLAHMENAAEFDAYVFDFVLNQVIH